MGAATPGGATAATSEAAAEEKAGKVGKLHPNSVGFDV